MASELSGKLFLSPSLRKSEMGVLIMIMSSMNSQSQILVSATDLKYLKPSVFIWLLFVRYDLILRMNALSIALIN